MINTNPYLPYVPKKGIPSLIKPEEISIIVPKYNTSKPDATGAFHPESQRFSIRWNLSSNVHKMNNRFGRYRLAKNFLHKMDLLSRSTPMAIWGFFCHGYTHGIQFGIRSPNHRNFTDQDAENWEEFCSIIARHSSPMVLLYACSTGDDPDGSPDTAPGSGDRSFSDELRDTLVEKGCFWCRVMAHTTAGHATKNPNIKFFDGEGKRERQKGAELIASPGTDEFSVLVGKLRDGTFRFEFPFMHLDYLRSQLT